MFLDSIDSEQFLSSPQSYPITSQQVACTSHRPDEATSPENSPQIRNNLSAFQIEYAPVTPEASHRVRATSSSQMPKRECKPTNRSSPSLFEKRIASNTRQSILCSTQDAKHTSTFLTRPTISVNVHSESQQNSNMNKCNRLKLHTPSPSAFPCSCDDVPFWYGNEEDDQIQWLLQRKYSNVLRETQDSVKTMMSRQVMIGRRLLHFVGCVKRIVETHSKLVFVTLDQIFIYQLDIAKLGATFPLHAKRYARTEYSSTDGTILKCTLLSNQEEYDECLSHMDSTHSHLTFLYQRPRDCCCTSMSLDDFEFLVSSRFFPETHSALLAQAIHRNFVHSDKELDQAQTCLEDELQLEDDEEDDFGSMDAFNFGVVVPDDMCDSPSPQTPPDYMRSLLSQDGWGGGGMLLM
uniref:Uncharacterized protein n=1 Tax=Percolomonas cosmopolitus TaxID=63605 RepID=A0A7S1KU54_9EUKA|mmetsp:Transcript_9680/g.35918  ORF Transcript_9680/g.35918 Transcript_9680/m.35918 type:complete len:407 (+) Transcript_9680:108-1328(+)